MVLVLLGSEENPWDPNSGQRHCLAGAGITEEDWVNRFRSAGRKMSLGVGTIFCCRAEEPLQKWCMTATAREREGADFLSLVFPLGSVNIRSQQNLVGSWLAKEKCTWKGLGSDTVRRNTQSRFGSGEDHQASVTVDDTGPRSLSLLRDSVCKHRRMVSWGG